MKKLKKTVVVSVLTLCMMIALLPCSVFAADVGSSNSQEPVTYIERSWNGSEVVETTRTVTDYIEVTPDTTYFANEKIYVVKGDVTVSDRILCDSHSRLVLTDGCTLQAEKGIGVDSGALFEIFGQEGNSGKLIANKKGENRDCAGIGGNHGSVRSTIQIHGGYVCAYPASDSWAPAIGGGTYGRGYELTVYGGFVKAYGSYGAAIGKGHGDSTFNGKGNTTISLYGGTIEAENGGSDAVIETSDLIVAGGAINVVSTWDGPAISSDNSVISGGFVLAASNAMGEVLVGPVSISGGSVFVIGRGSGVNLTAPVKITGGELMAIADGSSKMCEENLPITFTDNIQVVYGDTVGETTAALQAGDAEIPYRAKYLKATPIQLDGVTSDGSASIISDGSVIIIAACGALLVGAMLGLLLGKKIFGSKKNT